MKKTTIGKSALSQPSRRKGALSFKSHIPGGKYIGLQEYYSPGGKIHIIYQAVYTQSGDLIALHAIQTPKNTFRWITKFIKANSEKAYSVPAPWSTRKTKTSKRFRPEVAHIYSTDKKISALVSKIAGFNPEVLNIFTNSIKPSESPEKISTILETIESVQ